MIKCDFFFYCWKKKKSQHSPFKNCTLQYRTHCFLFLLPLFSSWFIPLTGRESEELVGDVAVILSLSLSVCVTPNTAALSCRSGGSDICLTVPLVSAAPTRKWSRSDGTRGDKRQLLFCSFSVSSSRHPPFSLPIPAPDSPHSVTDRLCKLQEGVQRIRSCTRFVIQHGCVLCAPKASVLL